MSEKKEPQ
jgi:hypothetical protein